MSKSSAAVSTAESSSNTNDKLTASSGKYWVGVPSDKMLDKFIENDRNVLLVGRHGVGKTSLILAAFERAGLKYKYFSAATMDPWVDFIGVPKEQSDKDGVYLDLVRPKDFRDDEVQALFFDEFNRSHKKVRNAVMELIHSKSINGRKFKNLRVVWVAVNPPEDQETLEVLNSTNYDVEPLDPAQEDRFHIKIELPYKPCVNFFEQKFGADQAENAIDWWNELSEKAKILVSPRRLETAVDGILNKSENPRHILPPISNPEQLLHILKHGSGSKNLTKLLENEAENISKNNPIVMKKLRDFLANENNWASCEKMVRDDFSVFQKVWTCIEDEKRMSIVTSIEKIKKNKLFQKILEETSGRFMPLLKEISESENIAPDLIRAAKARIVQHDKDNKKKKKKGDVRGGSEVKTADILVGSHTDHGDTPYPEDLIDKAASVSEDWKIIKTVPDVVMTGEPIFSAKKKRCRPPGSGKKSTTTISRVTKRIISGKSTLEDIAKLLSSSSAKK